MMAQPKIDGEYDDQIRNQRSKRDDACAGGFKRQSENHENREHQDEPQARQSLAWSSRWGGGWVRISTCSSWRKSTAGAILTPRKSPAPSRRTFLIVPTSKPRGKIPSRPEVTIVSPVRMSCERSAYFMITPSSTSPATIPRARERWSKPSSAELWSSIISTRDAFGLTAMILPTTPWLASTAMPGLSPWFEPDARTRVRWIPLASLPITLAATALVPRASLSASSSARC